VSDIPPDDDTRNDDAQANALSGAASNDNDLVGADDGGFDMLAGGDASDYFVFGPAIGASDTDFMSNPDANPGVGPDFLDLTTYGIDPLDLAAQAALVEGGGDAAVTVDTSHVIFLLSEPGPAANDSTNTDFLL
jgi:hypothetical protein